MRVNRYFKLSSACLSEELRLMIRSLNHEVISLIAAFIQADTTLWITDQVVFALLQLQGVHIKPLVNVARVKQKSVGGNGEQRLGVLPDAVDIKIFEVLAGEDHGAVFLPDSLHEVADIFHGRQVGKEQIELVNAGSRIAGSE